jgi:glucosamine--fructose-6-phosphate aminotransferase (isomerizing)
MCGIVGYLGSKSTKNILFDGLKALEYRGYDSSGIAILDKGEFIKFRAPGKIIELEKKVQDKTLVGHVGIAHTRWATHGPAVEKNAHPHEVGDICIVHNGIIENYQSIRQQLIARGAKINSDTDSELIAHLINEQLALRGDFYKAVVETRKLLEGAFAVLVISKKNPDEMIAFKSGPPMILAQGEDDFYIASDVQAVIKYTKKVYYLNDHEMIHIKNNMVTVTDLQGQALPVEFETISWNAEQVDKKGFAHYMLKEIYEQPNAVSLALLPHIDPETQNLKIKGFFDSPEQTTEFLKDINHIQIVACGTSFYSGMYAEYVFEKLAGISTEIDIASEYRYRSPILNSKTLVIFISQSGETADTLAALRLAKSKGARTLSICNTYRSSIDRESEFSIYMNSGAEIGVASTKAFTSTLVIMATLGLALTKAKGLLSEQDESKWIQSLLSLPLKMENVLAYDKFFKKVSHSLKSKKGFLYMGRGTNFPIAMEGALKLKELAYKHAEGYAAGEMKHGPLALIDEDMMIIMLCPEDDLYEKTMSNLEEVKARKGLVIGLGSIGDQKLEAMCEHFLGLPQADWITYPILETLPLQLLAYHVADSLGHDVDQPRNLAKSVTVE